MLTPAAGEHKLGDGLARSEEGGHLTGGGSRLENPGKPAFRLGEQRRTRRFLQYT